MLYRAFVSLAVLTWLVALFGREPIMTAAAAVGGDGMLAFVVGLLAALATRSS